MEEFGHYLKSHREKKGIRLEEIASITKIHLHNLELLESGKMDKLPPEPFIRGFITAYAKYVGLSPKETIEKYAQAAGLDAAADTTATGDNATAAPVARSIPAPAGLGSQRTHQSEASEVMGKFQLPSWPKLMTAAGVFLVAGVSLLLIQVGKNADAPDSSVAQSVPTQVEMAADSKPAEAPGDTRSVANQAQPTAPIAAPTVAAVAPTVNAAAPAVAPQPGQAAHNIEIEGAERTWVKVVADNEAPVEFFLSPGQKKQYTANQKIKVVLGNATGAKVIHNGEEATGKKFMGTIRSFRFPATAQFPQDVPKPAALTPAPEGEAKSDD